MILHLSEHLSLLPLLLFQATSSTRPLLHTSDATTTATTITNWLFTYLPTLSRSPWLSSRLQNPRSTRTSNSSDAPVAIAPDYQHTHYHVYCITRTPHQRLLKRLLSTREQRSRIWPFDYLTVLPFACWTTQLTASKRKESKTETDELTKISH